MFSMIRMLVHMRAHPGHLTMLEDIEIDPTKDTCEVCRFAPPETPRSLKRAQRA